MSVKVGNTGFRTLKLRRDMVEEARHREDPVTLTSFLEELDPSIQYHNDPQLRHTDAFQRQLLACGIRTVSDPGRGLYAGKVGDFWKHKRDSEKGESGVLFPEWVSRVWRAAAFSPMPMFMSGEGDEQQQRFYMSSSPVSDVLYPEYIQSQLRARQIAPAIPLSAIVARVETVNSGTYDSYRLTYSEDSERMRRVAEGTELPIATLTGGDETIKLRKYGRVLRASYETIRRMAIDKFAFHLARLAVQAEVDKVATALDVAVSGDGNSGTAATNYDLNGDLGGTVNDPSVENYFQWRMYWGSPYNCSVILAQEATLRKLLVMDTGSGNVMFGQLGGLFGGSSGIGTFETINPQLSTVLVGWTSDAPANKWVGIDPRFAIEMILEAGGQLVETDRLIRHQFEEIAVSEMVAFAVMDEQATKTCDLST